MRRHKLIYQSSYNRGLDVLLELWPMIRAKFPDATLDVCYGWELFDKMAPKGNKNVEHWKEKVNELLTQPGITHHGRVGQKELKEIRSKCGILAYPTYFREIFMIGAVEAQRDGVVPVTMKFGALPETVKAGVLVDGYIMDRDVQEKWLKALFRLMDNQERWEKLSRKGRQFAKKYSWDNVSKKWIKLFQEDKKKPLVTIYTPTVRDGWWNVMASNIASQTYKNVEWLIVDDKDEDRSEVAKKYAKEYGLNIRYYKSQKGKKRTYSLCRANNTAIKMAKGEIFVFLQDFILMSKTGIEQMVNECRRHPGDFIAGVDVTYDYRIKPNLENEEDWFEGEYDVVGQYRHSSVRLRTGGIRRSKNPLDFEQNFGATYTKTLRDLGGWWEFYDEALGWDDVQIAYRGFYKDRYKLYIDERNIAVGLDFNNILGKNEGGKSVNRERRHNDPRFEWMRRRMAEGRLPVKRDKKIDDRLELLYEVPEKIEDNQVVSWVKQNIREIVEGWDRENVLGEVKEENKEDILVSIYTPTVREGWWNLMASNIASQTYRNIEWIIVDDKKGDRSQIAEKYAKKYGLKIRYMRGKKRKVKRTYSLINANNTAIDKAKGELFVFLQDFILMPYDGIERLVKKHKEHPGDFIAPVDVYYKPKFKANTKNKEDWFDGRFDVMGKFMHSSNRMQGKGFRQSENFRDFEQNYGAVATKTLRELGGYWEFYDEALGWDDVDIVYRGFKKGRKLYIDEDNVAMGVDHWETLGVDEGGKSVNRRRRLNDPRFVWMKGLIDSGVLPVVRDPKLDDMIELKYEIPEEVRDMECVSWMRDNMASIIASWDPIVKKIVEYKK